MFSDQLRHFFFKCSIRPISIYIFKQITKRFIVCCVPTRVACLGCIYGRSEQISGFWSRHFKEACFRLIFTIKHHVVWMVRVKRSRFMFSPCSDGKYIKILLFPYVIKREHLSRKNMSTLALNYDAYGRKTKRSIKTYKICRVLFIFFFMLYRNIYVFMVLQVSLCVCRSTRKMIFYIKTNKNLFDNNETLSLLNIEIGLSFMKINYDD